VFIALDRVDGIDPVLEAADVQMPFGEIDLIPLEIGGLGHPQAVASHDQDQRGVTPLAALTGGFDELVELALANCGKSISAAWPVEEQPACFVIRDHNAQALGMLFRGRAQQRPHSYCSDQLPSRLVLGYGPRNCVRSSE
jgi:hypothetical protein